MQTEEKLKELEFNINIAYKCYVEAEKQWELAKLEKEKFLAETMYVFEKCTDIETIVKLFKLLPKELKDKVQNRDYSDSWNGKIKIYCTPEELETLEEAFRKVKPIEWQFNLI